jgi:hypothetical protein
MKNPLGFLFGGSNVANKVLDAAIKGGDALALTKEEEIQYKNKANELFIEQLKVQADSQSASSITRRLLAVMFAGLFTCYGVAAGMFWGFDKPEIAQGFINLMDSLDVLVGMVMTFYFGRHFAKDVFNKKA